MGGVFFPDIHIHHAPALHGRPDVAEFNSIGDGALAEGLALLKTSQALGGRRERGLPVLGQESQVEGGEEED